MIRLLPRARRLSRKAVCSSFFHPQITQSFSTDRPAPPTPPPSPTTNHNDLKSFLTHAERTSLSPGSTTYVGTHYEYTILEALRRYRLSLTRIGGRADSGIDLVGTWDIPALPHPLRVIVQCKALKAKLGPSIIRELEGTFVGAPVGWRGEGILGILVSPRETTKGVREVLAKSSLPLVWITAGLDGQVHQVLWNSKASNIGLQGLDVQIQYGANGDSSKKSLALLYDGNELEGLDSDGRECSS